MMSHHSNADPTLRRRDVGAVLLIVLVVIVALGLAVLAIAKYTTATLAYGQVSEQRADRFAAAQAAMDDALERLEIKRSACATGAGVVTEPFPVVINNAPAEVTCRSVGGTAGDVDGWALVLTGIGDPDYDLIVQSGGGDDKYIGGPVWMERPTSMNLLAPIQIEGGDLWYPGGCVPSGMTDLSASLDNDLLFSPGNGTWCTSGLWSSMFRAPATPTLNALSPDNGGPGTLDANGCTVFRPGRYTTAPILGEHNYFQSGNYYFRNVGTIVIKQRTVHFGNMEGLEGFPSIEAAPCDQARGSDSVNGATVYVGGNTRFQIEAQGALEFSSRAQIGSAKTDKVSLHVLDPGLGGQPTWDDPVVRTDSGNNKQLAIQGLVWAPNAGLQFGEVTNDTSAVLRGGAVLAHLDAGASASATGFLIEIPAATSSRMLELTSTATNDGTTSIRAVLDWRPSTGEAAMKSWRVCDTSAC
jgi:Tfp pilus assembly protein PilV